jgi:hypothetical protein
MGLKNWLGITALELENKRLLKRIEDLENRVTDLEPSNYTWGASCMPMDLSYSVSPIWDEYKKKLK